MAINNFRDFLRPASWRGIPFEVAADDGEFGRNVVVHEFVQRNKPYVEDLGRKTRKFKMEAWVCAGVQNDFNPMPQRDALIAAVEEGGVGTLVHPFYGNLRGHISHIAVKQTTTVNGGMVSMTMEFIEAGDLEFRETASVDTLGRVNQSAGRVYETARNEFAERFSTAGAPGFVAKDARDMVKQLNAAIAKQPGVSGLFAQVSLNGLQNIRINR